MNKIFLILAAALFAFVPFGAWADDALPKDFFKTEGAGLLQSQKDGAFGDGLWNGSEREDITALIRLLPVSSENYTVQRLIDSILLGQSDTKALEGAKNVTPGEDLLTLRLEKLFDGGQYNKALDLFTAAAGETPYHPKLAKAGILSMLGSKQKSLACVEAKIFDNGEIDAEFWTDIRAYCDYTLADEPSETSKAALKGSPYDIVRSVAFNKDFEFTYSKDGYGKLSALEQVILIAEQKITPPPLSPSKVDDLSQAHLAALLALDSITGKEKLLLSIRGAELGLITSAQLSNIYKASDSGESTAVEGLPGIYKALAKASEPPEKEALLRQALALKGKYGVVALLPFGEFLDSIILEMPSLDEMDSILQLSHRLQNPISSKLIDNFLKNTSENEKNDAYLDIILKAYLLSKGSQRQELGKIIQKNSTSENSHVFFIANVIENLDKQGSNVDNAAIVYEKDFVLTTQTQHVMPSYALWNRLNAVSKSKTIGETVLLSIFILGEQNMGHIYPGLFQDIVKNFDRVGLSHISRDLAVEALTGKRKEKE